MFSLVLILVVPLFEVPVVVGEEVCILPPFPKNGNYTILNEISAYKPGERSHSYILKVTCDPGFHLDGNYDLTCLQGLMSDDILPECIPYCQVERPNVVSCRADHQNESTCYINQLASTRTDDLNTNRFSNDEVCGKVGPEIVKILAGGVTAMKEELPWHVGIYAKTYNPYMQICGGTLVSTTVVISAAHCFWSDIEKQLPADRYAVAVGKIYRPWNNPNDDKAQKSDVQEIKIPPRFQGSAANFQEDIALVVVCNAFTFTDSVRPVCLDFDYGFDSTQLQDGYFGKVAGWGLTSEDGRASPTLQVAEVPYISIERCVADAPPAFREYITGDKICAGYNNGTAVCKGDSGGGLSFPTEGIESRYFLRGVVSAAPRSDHLCSVYQWATFTHIIRHEHFIRTVLDKKRTSADVPTSAQSSLRYADSRTYGEPTLKSTTTRYTLF